MNSPDEPIPEPNPSEPAEPMRAPTARVPESVAEGVFSTGVIVMTGASEFVLDFIQNLGGPAKLASRVVVPHNIMPQFVQALRHNLQIYQKQFGTPAQPAQPPSTGNKRPTIQEVYDELKLPDEKLSGAYANGLMVGHTASEFKLDFLTNLPPHSAVSARVFLAAPQIPRMIDSLSKTCEQFQQRVRQQQQKREDNPGSEPKEPPEQPPGLIDQ